jgi:hypothetical protein
MKSKKLLAAAVLAIAATSAQAANLVTNGSFEADAQANGSWNIYPTLTGWTGIPNIELRNNVAGAAQDGVNFVELDANFNSGMSQSINTATGLYELSFWYSAREGVAAGSNGLDFSFGSLTGNVLYNVAGAPSGHIWQHYTGLVTLSGPTTLTFSAAEKSDSLGGSLDNVSVTAVPEPETYALLLAGLGLIGTIARRRKNSPV